MQRLRGHSAAAQLSQASKDQGHSPLKAPRQLQPFEEETEQLFFAQAASQL